MADQSIAEWIGDKCTDPSLRPFAVICKATDVCQYACNYCYVEPQHETKIMPLGTATILIDRVIEYVEPGRKISCVWHGGEPLLAGIDYFEGVARHCEQYPAARIEHCLQTNGKLLDDRVLEFAKECGFLVSVSIDGPKRVHDANRRTMRGDGTFETTMQAVENIRAAGLTPGCVCVLNKANVSRIEELYGFFRRERIHFRVNPVVRSGRAVSRYNDLAITPREYGEAMCRLFDLWFDDDDGIQVEPLHTIVGNFAGPTVWGCDYGGRCLESIISVNPDGAVYPCGRFAGLDEFKLGNVLDRGSLGEMFTGGTFDRLRQRSVDTVPGCRECEFVAICNTGCMITAHMARNDILDRDYYCQGRRMLFDHIAGRLREHLEEVTPPVN